MKRYLGDAALDQAVEGDVIEPLIAVDPHHCANVAYGLRRGALGSCQRTERRVMVSTDTIACSTTQVFTRFVVDVSQHGNKHSVISLIQGKGQWSNIAAQSQPPSLLFHTHVASPILEPVIPKLPYKSQPLQRCG